MTSKQVGIFGTSGMAREAGDIVFQLGYEPVYVARDQAELKAWTFAAEVIVENDIFGYRDMSFVIGIGENNIRQKIAERYVDEIRFCNLIHPSATFGHRQRETLEKQKGVIVCAGVRFTNNIDIGDFTIFNQNSTIAHDVMVGDYTHIAPGCTISGNVEIGKNCWIGAGSVINQGTAEKKLHIGRHTTIGSGAVVIRSCEPNAVYAGVPARRIK